MRQLTKAEQELIRIEWCACDEDSTSDAYDIFEAAFIAGLDHAAKKIATLEAENERLRAAQKQDTKQPLLPNL